jgi:hypothetical protein
MSQFINHRNVLRKRLPASGGLAVLSQLDKVASPPHDVQRNKQQSHWRAVAHRFLA